MPDRQNSAQDRRAEPRSQASKDRRQELFRRRLVGLGVWFSFWSARSRGFKFWLSPTFFYSDIPSFRAEDSGALRSPKREDLGPRLPRSDRAAPSSVLPSGHRSAWGGCFQAGGFVLGAPGLAWRPGAGGRSPKGAGANTSVSARWRPGLCARRCLDLENDVTWSGHVFLLWVINSNSGQAHVSTSFSYLRGCQRAFHDQGKEGNRIGD